MSFICQVWPGFLPVLPERGPAQVPAVGIRSSLTLLEFGFYTLIALPGPLSADLLQCGFFTPMCLFWTDLPGFGLCTLFVSLFV